MSRTPIRRTVVGVLALALAVTGLTACSSEKPAADVSTMSLAQTKSPAQLLRNEAASRIPADIVEEITKSTDQSTACETSEQDPDGKLRKWDSSVRVVLTEQGGFDVNSVVENLVGTFIAQGWERGSHGGSIVKLTSKNSPTTIHISKVEADAEAGENSLVQLKASGPCVATDGAESSEVLELEARD